MDLICLTFLFTSGPSVSLSLGAESAEISLFKSTMQLVTFYKCQIPQMFVYKANSKGIKLFILDIITSTVGYYPVNTVDTACG